MMLQCYASKVHYSKIPKLPGSHLQNKRLFVTTTTTVDAQFFRMGRRVASRRGEGPGGAGGILFSLSSLPFSSAFFFLILSSSFYHAPRISRSSTPCNRRGKAKKISKSLISYLIYHTSHRGSAFAFIIISSDH